MSSWWIEGKIAGGFQYLPQACSSQESYAYNFWERQTWLKLHVIASWFWNGMWLWVSKWNSVYQWSIRSVNLFTAAIYNAEGKKQYFLVVTNLPDEGENSVCTFMLKLADEMTFKDEGEFIVYSDRPSSKFKNQFINGKLLFLLSQHLNLQFSGNIF